jgi:hypothetical protein
MEIKNVKVGPFEKFIFPCLQFYVEIAYTKYDEMIVNIGGYLESDDGKIIAVVNEVLPQILTSIGELWAKESHYSKEFKEDIYKATLIAILDKKALDYLENSRKRNKKGNVKLILNLHVKFLKSRTSISHLHAIDPHSIGLTPKVRLSSGREEIGKIVVYAYDSEFIAQSPNQWILSGDKSPVFLELKECPLKAEITISSSDWIYDYAPKLGLGEYFVVEIPKGRMVIQDAWSYIEKAEECFRRWDSKGVYAYCREAGKLLNNEIEKKFGKNSFIYNERWGWSYAKFEHLASLDLHIEDIKRSQKYQEEEIKVGRSDAEHLLIITKALIKYAEELLQESSSS